MAPTNKTLPPGRSGLPLLGETLTFLRDSFHFIQQRVEQHGPVFRTRLLGRPTAVIVGPEAAEVWTNPAHVIRKDAMPPNIQAIFGGADVLPLLDDDVHRRRKASVLAGFTPAMLESYIPGQQALIERYLAKWQDQQSFVWVPELKSLAIEGICTDVFGLRDAGTIQSVLSEYGQIGAGLAALPIPLSWTSYTRSLKARDRVLQIFQQTILDHQENPANDGLTQILSHQREDGSTITVDEATRELHHIVIAGLIVWAEFATLVRRLNEMPEIKQRLMEEIQTHAPEGPVTSAQLRKMPYLLQVVMETKRITPVVPVQFGRARETFEFKGYTIPKDWMLMLAIWGSGQQPELYPTPANFEPTRFSEERAEHKQHKHAFIPQGPGPQTGHQCPGLDYSTLFMQLFVILLLRGGHRWSFPDQSMDLQWNLIPPEPKDGLRVEFSRDI